MGDAAADVLLQFAMTTSSPNGTNKASGNAQASTEFKGNKLRK